MPTIAYLGPENTYTHLAAQVRFGRRSNYLHAPTVEDVFRLVELEETDFGVVPIENSLEGAVTHTLDRFIEFKQSPSRIVGEFEFPIRHHFIVHPSIKPSEVQNVYSHPQALSQCRRWIASFLSKKVHLTETDSTSEAVRMIANNLGGPSTAISGRRLPVAAIGHKEAARKYRLKAIPIPEERENKTRFLVIGLGKPRPGRQNKTSMLFALKDRPGALYDALAPFKRERINLTKIESRPSKKKAWEYYFFIDLEGHESEPRVKRALGQLVRHAVFLKVLGSYPTAIR